MRFTVLGSGTAIPDSERGPAGFLVEHAGRAWLVDGGSGTLGRLARVGFGPHDLAGGIYSHRHPDHCADLVPLLFSLRVSTAPRQAAYPIVAGEGFADFLEALRGVYGKWLDFGAPVTVLELPLDRPAQVDLDGLVIRTLPANHSAGALHLRFEADGASVVFSGDTGPSENLVALATDAQLLVCECAAPCEAPVEGHLTPTDVRDIVARARPGEVWLTHLYPAVSPEEALAVVASAGVVVRRAADLDVWESP